jgi:ketosteroid isomerase-like protein
MHLVAQWSKIGMLFSLIFILRTGDLGAGVVASPESARPDSCVAPEYRQLDCWLGDWDAFESGNSPAVARTRVERLLGGCVLKEDYQGTDGMKGQSFTIYDASRQVWHQTSVTNRGRLLMIEGKWQGGEMALSGMDHTAAGKERHVRGAWKPVEGGVREAAITSINGGKTWCPWFDLLFRPHKALAGNKANPTADDDEKQVAALDTQYQAAVAKNDAATMERILADDFVLVTGSGKTHSKADLLNEARSGRVMYERQEDSEQTVRVWGDTAIVTAKLWEKGTENGKAFEYTLWFSDTYVRTPTGWQYVFGQASLPLPNTPVTAVTAQCSTNR